MRSAIRGLTVAALALPVIQAVLVWIGALLAGMGDEDGAAVVHCVGTACLVVWTVTLVALLILLAIVVGNEVGVLQRKELLESEEEL
jgi:hypothetical protein